LNPPLRGLASGEYINGSQVGQNVALEIAQSHFQVLTAIGMIGIFVGWRGGMQRMAGFYDMPSATKHLAYGIAIGAFSGWFIDNLFVQRVVATGLVFFDVTVVFMLLLGMAQAVLFHFILTRSGTINARACATSGWTLGLGLGALQAVYLMIRMADPLWPGFVSGFNPKMLVVGFWLVIHLPALEAMLGSWQGSSIIEKRPWGVLWKAGLLRGLILIIALIGITSQPVLLIVLLPAAVLGFNLSGDRWLPSALLPEIRQEFDRTSRASTRRRRQQEERVRGERVFEEE
jgi:hypothetical protein